MNLPALPLGLGLVAAATRAAGHEVRLLDLLSEADPDAAMRAAVEAARPDVIGIGVRNIDDQCREDPRFLLDGVTAVIAACRTCSPAPVVLGGAGYSIFPAATLAYLGADFGVRGEGEVAFPGLLARLERREDPTGVPGVLIAGDRAAPPPGMTDLDGCPLPGPDLWPTAAPGPDVWVPVQTRRGCPFDCSYCSTPAIEGRRLRARSPERMAQEIGRLARAGYRRFYFVDNTFHGPPAYGLELCRRIVGQRVDITWRCILYPRQVPHDLVEAMAAAGCVEVGLGFESGAPRVLQAMNKRFTPAEVRDISDRLGEAGIRRMGFLLLGGPGETQETVGESLAFAASLRLDLLRVTTGIRIYPGTPLARTAVREGVIGAEDDLLRPRFYLIPGLKLPPAAPA